MLGLSAIVLCGESLASNFFDDIEWQLKRDKKSIQVYTGKLADSKYRAVFSTMQVSASAESVAALLLDLPNCRQWASMCREARVIERISDLQSIVYGLNDIPFPVRDRDSYSKVTWSFNPETGVISMDSESLPESAYPLRKGVVRIGSARASWRIVPIENDQVIIENYVHVDPNGKVPRWATNLLIIDGPYKALRKLRSILNKGDYRQAKVAFLQAAPHGDGG